MRMDRRMLNDDRRRRFGEPGRTLALLCECGDDSCQETVLLTVEEFDARRPGPLVHPVHASFGAGGADAGAQDSRLQ
jgi:hypothetical protein